MVGPDAPFQYVEAYKSLRTNLEFLSASTGCKVILITSSVQEEGKSNVAINLASTMASGGKRVVLVDSDLRKGSLSRYLHLSHNRPGISNIVAGQATLNDALVRFKNVQFTLLPVGPLLTPARCSRCRRLSRCLTPCASIMITSSWIPRRFRL